MCSCVFDVLKWLCSCTSIGYGSDSRCLCHTRSASTFLFRLLGTHICNQIISVLTHNFVNWCFVYIFVCSFYVFVSKQVRIYSHFPPKDFKFKTRFIPCMYIHHTRHLSYTHMQFIIYFIYSWSVFFITVIRFLTILIIFEHEFF